MAVNIEGKNLREWLDLSQNSYDISFHNFYSSNEIINFDQFNVINEINLELLPKNVDIFEKYKNLI